MNTFGITLISYKTWGGSLFCWVSRGSFLGIWTFFFVRRVWRVSSHGAKLLHHIQTVWQQDIQMRIKKTFFLISKGSHGAGMETSNWIRNTRKLNFFQIQFCLHSVLSCNWMFILISLREEGEEGKCLRDWRKEKCVITSSRKRKLVALGRPNKDTRRRERK